MRQLFCVGRNLGGIFCDTERALGAGMCRREKMQSDTIAAIATGMTNAGIGKVRLSGDDAVMIVDRIYRSPGGR